MSSMLRCLGWLSVLTAAVGALADDVVRPAEEIHVVRVGPGCLGGQRNAINIAGALFDPLARDRGSYALASVGQSAIERGPNWLFPDAAHVTETARVVDVVAGEGALSREVLDAALPVLIGSQDLAFQWPREGRADMLAIIEEEVQRTGRLEDLKRVSARLVRYTRGRTSVLGLELDERDSRPVDDDRSVLGWNRQVEVTATARVGDDETTIYAFGRRTGDPGRMKAALDALMVKTTSAKTVLVHMGGLAVDADDVAQRAICVAELSSLGFDAIVPRARDLALGRAGLDALRSKGALPFIAANLRDGQDQRPFPRFVVVERAGLTVGIIGVVNPRAMALLPTSARSDWHIDAAPAAIDDAVRAMREKLRRQPDLTIVMGAYAEEELEQVTTASRVDVVLYDEWERNDLIERIARVSVGDARGGREMQRDQIVSMVAASQPYALSHVSARFDGTAANGRRRLVELVHEQLPLVDGMPGDEAVSAHFRVLEEGDIAKGAVLLIPDPNAFLRAHEEQLAPVLYGEQVLYLGRFQRRDKAWSPFITDPLWMNLVVNALKNSTSTEVVLARNLPRNDDILGPIPRFVLDDWLSTPDNLMTTTLTGAELLQVAAHMSKQLGPAGPIAGPDYVFAAGLDAAHGRIGGRAINGSERYTVAFAESVATLADLQGTFRDHDVVAGKSVREIVMSHLESERDPAAIHQLLLDHSDVLVDKVSFGFDELALQGLAFRNSDNVSLFAESRETRLSNPNLFQIAARANGFFLYDGPWLANEWRLKVQLDSIVFDVPGETIPPQEQRDDVVASTELRINKVKVGIADDSFQIIPFVQTAFDTEVTPTQDPADPTKTLAHQLVLRESAGLVAYPGSVIKELRVGALVQQDFSEAADPKGSVHNDFGVVAAYKLHLPLVWQLAYESDLDLRYLVPDGDDRPGDLALRAQTTHKIVLPLSQSIAFFVFLDAFIVSGKTAANSELGGNGIVGVGMQFADVWKL